MDRARLEFAKRMMIEDLNDGSVSVDSLTIRIEEVIDAILAGGEPTPESPEMEILRRIEAKLGGAKYGGEEPMQTITHPVSSGPFCEHDWMRLFETGRTESCGQICRKCGEQNTWTTTYGGDPDDDPVTDNHASAVDQELYATRTPPTPDEVVEALRVDDERSGCSCTACAISHPLAAAVRELAWKVCHMYGEGGPIPEGHKHSPTHSSRDS